MSLDTQTLGIILGLLGGGGLLGLLGKAYAKMKQLDDKQDKSACLLCRKEIDSLFIAVREEIHTRAHKSEVIAHAALLAEHGKSLAVLEANLRALADSMHRVERLVEQLVERA